MPQITYIGCRWHPRPSRRKPDRPSWRRRSARGSGHRAEARPLRSARTCHVSLTTWRAIVGILAQGEDMRDFGYTEPKLASVVPNQGDGPEIDWLVVRVPERQA